MDGEGNMPYLTGETVDLACPAAPNDGPDTDDEEPDMANMPRNPLTGRCVWEFGGAMDVPQTIQHPLARMSNKNMICR
jgi:hypothetical protein